MTSKKRSSRAKKVAEFEAQLGGMDDIFSSEEQRRERAALDKADALRNKACESKNRYETQAEAREAIALCAEHGRTDLRCYKCDYCGGWHLTSKGPR